MKTTKTIAVAIDPDQPVKSHHEVIAGIQRYAREARPLSEDPDSLSREVGEDGWKLIPDLFPQRDMEQYDAVIGRITPDIFAKASPNHWAIVNTWVSSPVAEKMPTVVPDEKAIADMAVRHLFDRGFRSFGFLGYSPKFGQTLRDAFELNLQEAGFPCSSILVSDKHSTGIKPWAQFNKRLEEWIDSWSPPIGILCAEDHLNRHLAGVCEAKGIAVPQEAALIGTHDEPSFCLSAEPWLSSIDLGFNQLGFRAAGLLDELMQGKTPPIKPIRVTPKTLVPRQSTDAYVANDPLVAEALRFIAANSHKRIMAEDIARSVNVSRRNLDRHFAESGRYPVARELLNFRLEHLKRLLVQTDEPIKCLAHETGFKDANQMSATFRRMEGVSPSTYRQQHANGTSSTVITKELT